jgi:hypothetical protein
LGLAPGGARLIIQGHHSRPPLEAHTERNGDARRNHGRNGEATQDKNADSGGPRVSRGDTRLHARSLSAMRMPGALG